MLCHNKRIVSLYFKNFSNQVGNLKFKSFYVLPVLSTASKSRISHKSEPRYPPALEPLSRAQGDGCIALAAILSFLLNLLGQSPPTTCFWYKMSLCSAKFALCVLFTPYIWTKEFVCNLISFLHLIWFAVNSREVWKKLLKDKFKSIHSGRIVLSQRYSTDSGTVFVFRFRFTIFC